MKHSLIRKIGGLRKLSTMTINDIDLSKLAVTNVKDFLRLFQGLFLSLTIDTSSKPFMIHDNLHFHLSHCWKQRIKKLIMFSPPLRLKRC
ncbi:CLUMA_CG016064, isoform A [Clunio marinus]|uniref:CLUMA_CG016064, isoform A n=1 Tax=Clunio marinus TaxID=568069 RepID=A0A1J1IW97_9DIPT|nr:CLUMA_CG016064, isoform A [Clunio marinus]